MTYGKIKTGLSAFKANSTDTNTGLKWGISADTYGKYQ